MEIKAWNYRNRIKNIFDGMKSIYMPTFYRNKPLIKFEMDYRKNSAKLSDDYKKSLSGIRKEVQSFEITRRG